ncbi:hypothetical protein RF11_03521 [Thelohanellus kitauei]|uniref:Uncharacterized protein n=1 Tax=Thelohanellus kitauei TaxID=669202 RepID=A0A0C2J6J0_THEKT|nr:hypothetical protein RF11_03521 [Thelohanellus kitauei]
MEFTLFTQMVSDAANGIGFLPNYGILQEEMFCEKSSEQMVEYQMNDISNNEWIFRRNYYKKPTRTKFAGTSINNVEAYCGSVKKSFKREGRTRSILLRPK